MEAPIAILVLLAVLLLDAFQPKRLESTAITPPAESEARSRDTQPRCDQPDLVYRDLTLPAVPPAHDPAATKRCLCDE